MERLKTPPVKFQGTTVTQCEMDEKTVTSQEALAGVHLFQARKFFLMSRGFGFFDDGHGECMLITGSRNGFYSWSSLILHFEVSEGGQECESRRGERCLCLLVYGLRISLCSFFLDI